MTTEQRIEKEAEDYANSMDRIGTAIWQGMYRGYMAGGKAERNKVIEEIIEKIYITHSFAGLENWISLKRTIQSLKLATPNNSADSSDNSESL